MLCFYLSHPQVAIDPDTPVPQWHLSDKGRTRLEALAGKHWVGSLRRIVSSDETKAIETAIAVGALEELGQPIADLGQTGVFPLHGPDGSPQFRQCVTPIGAQLLEAFRERVSGHAPPQSIQRAHEKGQL